MIAEEFINNLKRDKARGSLAPHQIILLISLFRIYNKNEKKITDILILNNEFQEVWYNFKSEFKSTNNKLGLPLKAFVNKGYLTIGTNDQIFDFRNLSELESKISKLEMQDILIALFKVDKIEDYLISRIKK
ncbi:hypothetical protein C8C84_2811 [Flavobacterium sp. 102]|nr:hypothetical protein C8C84_2811 [Flavobacterium sp. 102]